MHQIAMMQQVLHLDRDVVGDLRVRSVQCLDYAQGVGRTVEEIRIAERDVLSAGADLRIDISEHDLRSHDSKLPAIDGDHRTVATYVLAPAARFGRTHDLLNAASHV